MNINNVEVSIAGFTFPSEGWVRDGELQSRCPMNLQLNENSESAIKLGTTFLTCKLLALHEGSCKVVGPNSNLEWEVTFQ